MKVAVEGIKGKLNNAEMQPAVRQWGLGHCTFENNKEFKRKQKTWGER